MKKSIFLLIVILFSLNTYSQDKGVKKVLKRSECVIRDFNKDNDITIEFQGNEMEGHIETALFAAGFNIVSKRVAERSLNISNPLHKDNKEIKVSKSTKVKSVYVLTVSSTLVPSLKCSRVVTSFNARIVDLADGGKLVGTFVFRGSNIRYACPEVVARAFAYKLEEVSK